MLVQLLQEFHGLSWTFDISNEKCPKHPETQLKSLWVYALCMPEVQLGLPSSTTVTRWGKCVGLTATWTFHIMNFPFFDWINLIKHLGPMATFAHLTWLNRHLNVDIHLNHKLFAWFKTVLLGPTDSRLRLTSRLNFQANVESDLCEPERWGTSGGQLSERTNRTYRTPDFLEKIPWIANGIAHSLSLSQT